MQQPEFGRKVAEYRKNLGLTQDELAEKCGINVRSIQRIEAGTVKPRMHTVRLLAGALDFEADMYENNNLVNGLGFFADLFNFGRDPDSVKTQLKVAWIAGVIYFVMGIPEFALEMVRQYDLMTGMTALFYVGTAIFSLIATIYFYRGFVVMGRESGNPILLISAYFIIFASAISYALDIFSLGQYESFREAIKIAESFTFGFLGVFFGAGLIKMQDRYGSLAKYAGVLEIIAGATFIIVILFFLGFIILIPATILEILILYRACNNIGEPAYSPAVDPQTARA